MSCSSSFGGSSTQQCFMSDFYPGGSRSDEGSGTFSTQSNRVPNSWAAPAVGYCSSNQSCCKGYECALTKFSNQVWGLVFGVANTVMQGVGSCLIENAGGSKMVRRNALAVLAGGTHPAKRKTTETRKCLCHLNLANEQCCRGGTLALS